jgi:nucleoside-diphosphate-sugar epimerase
MKMELAVREFERRGLIETVIIRPPWFYGPNQPPRQTLLFKLIRDGKFPMVGDGSNLRSMSFIGNLVQGLLLAESVPAARGQIYWIADERPYSMNEIVDTIRSLLRDEFKQKVAKSTTRLPWVAGEVATLVDATIQRMGRYEQRIHVLSEMNKTIACSIKKAQIELGYSPLVDLREGMYESLTFLTRTSGTL